MSRYIVLVGFLVCRVLFAGEAVLIPKTNGENVYVRKYEISQGIIEYVDCNAAAGASKADQYTIMNDDSACLAVNFGKQMETIRLALRTVGEIPELSNVVVEYRKLDAAGFKSKEEVVLGHKNTPYSKFGQIQEGDRFNLIFYVDDGRGCRYSDLRKLQEKLVRLGFSESYFRLVKNKVTRDCHR